MKFLIEIEGNTQPDLIRSIDRARQNLIDGACYLNICGETKVKPATEADEDEFRRQAAAAHPKPAASWFRG